MDRKWVGSPNFTASRGGNRIEGWIIHWMVGNLASTDSVFQDPIRNTSAHTGIEDGSIHEYVRKDHTAYHAGNYGVNQRTIGYELSAAPGRPPSDHTYNSLCEEMARDAREYGIPVNYNTVRFHYQIVSTRCNENIIKDRIINKVNEILALPSAPAPAPLPSTPSAMGGVVNILVDALNARTEPKLSGAVKGQFKRGVAQYTAVVQGESINGVSTWLKSLNGNYFWAGNTSYPTTPAVVQSGGRATVSVPVANVRAYPSINAPLAGSKQLKQGQWFDYSAIVVGDYVGNNNRWYRSKAGNFVHTSVAG